MAAELVKAYPKVRKWAALETGLNEARLMQPVMLAQPV
jgi:hypothetical protein